MKLISDYLSFHQTKLPAIFFWIALLSYLQFYCFLCHFLMLIEISHFICHLLFSFTRNQYLCIISVLLLIYQLLLLYLSTGNGPSCDSQLYTSLTRTQSCSISSLFAALTWHVVTLIAWSRVQIRHNIHPSWWLWDQYVTNIAWMGDLTAP